MALTDEKIDSVTNIISIYVAYFIVTIGLIGNVICIVVFTQLKLFRRNQSVLYLTVAAVVQSYQLIVGSAIRATTNAFGFDPGRTSLVWCKFRSFSVQFTIVISTFITCFAAIDQYLSTSYHPRIRQWSTFKIAQRAVALLIIFAIVYNIPFLIFYEIHSNCSTFDARFNFFFSFIHFCLITGIIPIIISSLFSFLAYRNVRRIVRRQIALVRRRLDHQLTAMVLVRVVLFVITNLPYVSIRIYQINYPANQSDKLAVSIERLINIVSTTVYTINYSGVFYLFLASSNRFRRQVKCLFQKKFWRKCLSKGTTRNHVAPEILDRSNSSSMKAYELCEVLACVEQNDHNCAK